MAKWADYLISAVSYNSRHTHIDQVMAHLDSGDTVGEGKIYNRSKVVELINDGKTFCTIVKNSEGRWDKGQKVFIINVNGVSYIKTVDNGTEADNLENLPEF
jgi:hypothetical protein